MLFSPIKYIRMFTFDKLDHVQVEITNRCQAKCPMCLRNIHGGIKNTHLIQSEWTLFQFKKIFSSEVLQQIRCVDFCGDFGDPIFNNDLPDMCQYIKDHSTVSVTIKTNGSARPKRWWQQLARCLPDNHRVEFALDGLSNTHGLYRIGTDFETIIRNAQAFIAAGGTADWMFIKFLHNQHQVAQAKQQAQQLGFKSFSVKNSKRFGKQFPVVDQLGIVTHMIDPPADSVARAVEFLDLKEYKTWKDEVSCFALDSKELYIDAHGHMMPCCLIASFLYANYDLELYKQYGLVDDQSIIAIAQQVQLEVLELINEFGGLESLDAARHGIRQIMEQPVWQSLMHKKWSQHSSSACKILCGVNSPYTKLDQQIKENWKFDV
jgi:4Fe-4S single cluster domain